MEKEARFEAILLLGPTAAGKTPLGDTISSKGIEGQPCFHFDFGSELRHVAGSDNHVCTFTSREIHFIRVVLEEGLLLEDKQLYLAKKIFHAFIERKKVASNDIIILNGLPRHIGQAEGMTEIVDVKTVVKLICSWDNVLFRINENTGGDRAERVDDHHRLVQKKIETYHKRTAPLTAFYRDHGANIIDIEVTTMSGPASIYEEFLVQFNARPQNVQ